MPSSPAAATTAEAAGTIISSSLPATNHFPVQWNLDPSSGLMVLSSSLHAKRNQQILEQIRQAEDQCSWRAKTRMKTFGIVCCLCLNLGTEPPDVIKVPPHAVTECGVDPSHCHADYLPAALNKISVQLEQQWRDFQGPKVRLKICPDPVMDEIKRSLFMMRKNAAGGRVVFHFNGHGVPAPTVNGEVWVYNEEFSQYIPVSIFDLTKWAGSPSVFIFDANRAGMLIPFFNKHLAEQERKFQAHLQEWQAPSSAEEEGGRPTAKNYLVLCSCAADEDLPTAPTLPADLFTSCLTVPVPTALKWFVSQHPLQMQALGIEQRMIDFIPQGESRKSMKGELTWIFSMLTDTIAYNVFPPQLFQRLFREDVTMSNLFHNYLLAERIFRSCGRKPCTIPPLPETWKHMLWETWDYTVERSLMQLPGLIPGEILQQHGFTKALAVLQSHKLYYTPQVSYTESRFFRDQLLAFENWLTVFPVSSTPVPPLQLPVILQLVVSKQHRFQALSLLAQFLDQSPLAISQALAVGIFPYILKSLKSITTAAAQPSSGTGTTSPLLEEDSMDDLKTNLLRICVHIATFQPLLTRELFDYSPFFVGELKPADEFSQPALACFVLSMICQLPDERVKMTLLSLDMDRIVAMHIQPVAEYLYDEDHSSNSSSSEDGEQRHSDATSDDEGNEEEEAGASEEDVFVLGESPSHARSGGETSSASPSQQQQSLFSPKNHHLQSRRHVNSTLIIWSCLLLAKFWQGGFELGRSRAYSFHLVHHLERLLCTHSECTVREAAAHALGMLFGSGSSIDSAFPRVTSSSPPFDDRRSRSSSSITKPVALSTLVAECDLILRMFKAAKSDASPLVRREILFATSRFVLDEKHIDAFRFTVHVLSDFMGEAGQVSPTYNQLIDKLNALIGHPTSNAAFGKKYMAIWMDLSLVFTVDPFPALSQTAQILVGKVKTTTDQKWAELKQQQHVVETAVAPQFLLESDLYERSRYMLARPLKEVEEERFQNQMKAWQSKKQNQDAQTSEHSWGQEIYLFVNHVEEMCYCEWYEEEEREVYDANNEDNPAVVKEPFFRLFKQPSGSLNAMLSTASTSSLGAAETQQQSPPSGPRQQPNTMRRFDELPLDVFNSTNSTKLRRSTNNLPGLLTRQASNGSIGSRSNLGSKSSPNFHSLQLVRQSSNTSMQSTTFATKSVSSSPNTNKQFIELDRIEFKTSNVGAQDSAKHFTSSFHPYTPHFLLANETTISVFEAENFRQPVSVFSNFNLHSQINDLTWIDSKSASPLLLVSTDDGQCRVWRDVTSATPKLASAFSPTAGKQNHFQVDWLPTSSHLVCVSSNMLKAWDLVSELPTWECVPDCAVTALSTSEHANTFVAGFADGTVKLFDLRVGYHGTFQPVATSAAVNRKGQRFQEIGCISKMSKNSCFATSGRAGEVRVWEMRKTVLKHVHGFEVEPFTQLSFHENGPMLAYAPRIVGVSTPNSNKQAAVKVVSFDGTPLSAPIYASTKRAAAAGGSSSMQRYNSNTGGAPLSLTPLSSILSLEWDPREIALATVTQESASVYVCANTRVRGVWTPANFEPEPYRI